MSAGATSRPLKRTLPPRIFERFVGSQAESFAIPGELGFWRRLA